MFFKKYHAFFYKQINYYFSTTYTFSIFPSVPYEEHLAKQPSHKPHVPRVSSPSVNKYLPSSHAYQHHGHPVSRLLPNRARQVLLQFQISSHLIQGSIIRIVFDKQVHTIACRDIPSFFLIQHSQSQTGSLMFRI